MFYKFQCFSCGDITEYDPKSYIDALEPKTTVVAYRIYTFFIKCRKCGVLNKVEAGADSIPPEKPAKGFPPSIKDDVYIELAGEFVMNNTKVANDFLRQLIALNSALITITIAFLTKEVINDRFKLPIIIAFLVGLVYAIKGAVPLIGKISFINPNLTEKFNDEALNIKLHNIRVSGKWFILGLSLIIVSGIWKITVP